MKFWNNVYGYKMSIMREFQYRDIIFDFIEEEGLNSSPFTLYKMDLGSMKLEDLSFIRSYELKSKFADRVDAIVMWFNIEFTKGINKSELVNNPRYQQKIYETALLYLKQTFKF